MNWIIPIYYNNREFKSAKCHYCGNEIICNPNILSKNYCIIPLDLDSSPHNCENKPKREWL